MVCFIHKTYLYQNIYVCGHVKVSIVTCKTGLSNHMCGKTGMPYIVNRYGLGWQMTTYKPKQAKTGMFFDISCLMYICNRYETCMFPS